MSGGSDAGSSGGCGASLARRVQRVARPVFSQTRILEDRKRKGLHPISELRRFHLLTCCFFCSIGTCVISSFDLFVMEFELRFGLNAYDNIIIGAIGTVLSNFTIPYSFIFMNIGPLLTFWMSAIAATIGGSGLAGVFRGSIRGNTASITVFYAFLNMAQGLLKTSIISTLFEVFPRNRGPVVCLIEVGCELGTSVFAQLNRTLFETSAPGLMYFMMAICIAANIWASFTVVLPPYFTNWWRRQGKTKAQIARLQATEHLYSSKFVPVPRLIIGYVVVISLIIFFAVEEAVRAYHHTFTHSAKMAIGAITVILVMCIFLMLLPLRCLGGVDEPAPEELPEGEMEMVASGHAKATEPECAVERLGEWRGTPHDSAEPYTHLDDGMERNCDSDSSSAAEAPLEDYTHQDPRYKGTIKNHLKRLDFWLIMLLILCYGCMGTLMVNQSPLISLALAGHEPSKSLSELHNALLQLSAHIGRIAFGLFEAYVQHQDPEKRKVLVTTPLALPPLVACISGVLLLVLPGKAVLFPYILVYLEEGVFDIVVALIFPCLFDGDHSVLYNVGIFVGMCSEVAFGIFMFWSNLGMQLKKQGLPLESDCTVKSCVQMPLIVGTVLAFVGIFVALTIHFRYAAFVKRERARAARERERSRPPGMKTKPMESTTIPELRMSAEPISD